MRIDSSTIGMESARRYTSSATRTSRFMVRDYNGEATHGMESAFGNLLNPGTGENLETENGESEETTSQNTKDNAKSVLERMRANADSLRANRTSLRTGVATTLDSFRQQAIRSIFSLLFGASRAEELFGDYGVTEMSDTTLTASTSMQSISYNVLTVESEQFYQESESTSFSAKGVVKTADGREISINLDIGMSRTFSQYFKEELQVAQINTCDPLVLNFDGAAAELTDQKFFFDIDGDGSEDEISMLGRGSGYLALDKNEDGKINDGNELFGPKSGSGFADLSEYDEDGNGWIDENDAIWSKLKIWCKAKDGTDALYTLAEKGVGAISLQNAATDFALNNADNRTNGYIRSTGIFLYENGEVGTVQHLDVAN